MTSTTEQTTAFFRGVFQDSKGWLCIAWPAGKFYTHRFFEFPDDLGRAVEVAELVAPHRDVYFCAHLLNNPSYKRPKDGKGPRVKENTVDQLWTAWAELDSCNPEVFKTKPTYVVETSPNNYHAYWVLAEPKPAVEVELLNHKIAVAHRDLGCDQNGWALAKLLRVPNTINHKPKHLDAYGFKPAVKLVAE